MNIIRVITVSALICFCGCSYSESPCPSCGEILYAKDVKCPQCKHTGTCVIINKTDLQMKCKQCGESALYMRHPKCGFRM